MSTKEKLKEELKRLNQRLDKEKSRHTKVLKDLQIKTDKDTQQFESELKEKSSKIQEYSDRLEAAEAKLAKCEATVEEKEKVLAANEEAAALARAKIKDAEGLRDAEKQKFEETFQQNKILKRALRKLQKERDSCKRQLVEAKKAQSKVHSMSEDHSKELEDILSRNRVEKQEIEKRHQEETTY
eukprot:jgi/Bigna1/83422/fgenesh1_pg.108_\